MQNQYIVSVFMITYNHEKYIAEAIEGILMQKTDFAFEIVIGEDCSTDNTRNIILEYAKKDPTKFKLLLHEKNIGALANQNEVFAHCNGKYIAMCEGDDYWTDPLKLQKQLDFLEANREDSACFHNAHIVDDKGKIIRLFHTKPIKNSHGFEDVIKNWIAPTASLFFRNSNDLILEIIEFSKYNFISADRLLHAILASRGFFGYLPDVMCAYRKHPGGISSWGNQVEISLSNMYMFRKLRESFDIKYYNNLTTEILRWHCLWAISLLRENKQWGYLIQSTNALRYVTNWFNLKTWVRIIILRK